MPPCTPTRKKRGLEGSGWPGCAGRRMAAQLTEVREDGLDGGGLGGGAGLVLLWLGVPFSRACQGGFIGGGG
jgi:hypothetical protein